MNRSSRRGMLIKVNRKMASLLKKNKILAIELAGNALRAVVVKRQGRSIAILAGAEIHDTVEEATAGSAWIVGTTRRFRRHQSKTVTPREWSARLAEIPSEEKVSILFGPEKTGLTNEDVLRCRLIITAPTPVEHPSLNLSQAVMLLAYETALGLREPAESVAAPRPATAEELERMYDTMDRALRVNEFDEKRRVSLVRHLRLILHRAHLTAEETQTFFTLASRIRGPVPRRGRPRE